MELLHNFRQRRQTVAVPCRCAAQTELLDIFRQRHQISLERDEVNGLLHRVSQSTQKEDLWPTVHVNPRLSLENDQLPV